MVPKRICGEKMTMTWGKNDHYVQIMKMDTNHSLVFFALAMKGKSYKVVRTNLMKRFEIRKYSRY